MNLRLASSRPVLIAIGPTSAAAVEMWNADLALLDVIIVEDAMMSPGDARAPMQALQAALLRERLAVACLFDVCDEAWCSVASRVATVVARLEIPVRLFVCADARVASVDRSAVLDRLSRHLDVCVLEARTPGEAVRIALLPLIGLVRSGLLGYDPADLVMFMRSASVGRAAFACGRRFVDDEQARAGVIARLFDARVSHAVVAIRCPPETPLSDVSNIHDRIAEVAPNASLLVAAVADDRFEVGILALRDGADR